MLGHINIVSGCIYASAEQKAGGNKNLRQGDSCCYPADGCRRTQRIDAGVQLLIALPVVLDGFQQLGACAAV